MTKFTNSSAFKPRYESRPYRQAPARREHIYGRILGLPDAPRLTVRRFIEITLWSAAVFYLLLIVVVR